MYKCNYSYSRKWRYTPSSSKREFRKKKEKRKLNPSRFREQSRNRYFLDGRIGTSPHPRRTARPCPTAITPHQIYSPQTSSLVSFSRVSSSLLLSLPSSVSLPFEKGREKHVWDDRGWIVDTDFGDRFSRYSWADDEVGSRIVAATNIRKEFFKKKRNQRFKLLFRHRIFHHFESGHEGRDKYPAQWILQIR